MSDKNGMANDQLEPADDIELNDDEIGAIAGGASANDPNYSADPLPPGTPGY